MPTAKHLTPTSEDGSADPLEWMRDDIEGDASALEIYRDTLARTSLLAQAKKIRGKNGINQKAVAKLMGTTQSAVSDLESGRVDPQFATLQRYARAIGRRLAVSFEDDSRGISTKQLWYQLEKVTLGPILTALITQRRADVRKRSVLGLADALLLPEPIIGPILADLWDRGWTTRNGEGSNQSYALKTSVARLIGVSLTGEGAHASLVDLNGTEKGTADEAFLERSPKEVAQVIARCVTGLARRSGTTPVIGVGVNLAGVVDSSGLVRFAPDLQSDEHSWRHVELERLVRIQLDSAIPDWHCPLVLENDANGLATYEFLRSGVDLAVTYLLTKSGIGAGLMVRGELVPGRHSSAGEVGHVVVDPDGPECRAKFGHVGCAETISTPQAMIHSLKIPAITAAQIKKGFAIVNDRIRAGDAEAIRVFEEAGRSFGRLIAQTRMLIDPAQTVIYTQKELVDSSVFETARTFQSGVRDGINEVCVVDPELTPATELVWREETVEENAKAAAAVAMKKFLSSPAGWAPHIFDAAISEPVHSYVPAERFRELV